MASYLFRFKAVIDSIAIAATTAWGSVRAQWPQPDYDWPSGTSAGQADKHWCMVGKSLANAANDDIDLKALAATYSPDGVAVALVEVRHFEIRARDGDLTITTTGANDWLGLFALGDVINLKQGARLAFTCPTDGEYPVGAATKLIRISNNSGAAVVYDLLIVGTSA